MASQLGLPLIVIMFFGAALGLVVVFALQIVGFIRKRARRFGHTSVVGYLKATPRSDEEKRDAVDLALRGLACCVLGLIFKPFVLVGLVPLFYGSRKLMCASMGLGLVDDADRA